MHILVTGGAGYVGSHTVLDLLEAGHDVTVVDNLVNSSEQSLLRVRELVGRSASFHRVDLLDKPGLMKAFAAAPVDAVMHFAALKAVGESVAQPLRYYHNNLTGTVNLLEAMRATGTDRLVFSSSATVYGDARDVPVREDSPLAATNPYGRTKVMMEEILRDMHAANPGWSITILRYFNPAGAHASGRIGEDPRGTPNNLVPYIAQVAVGRRPALQVFGRDYPTPDGTGVRDYIHVMDVAEGHLAALEQMRGPRFAVYNLGSGRGHSVLEVVTAFEQASGRRIPLHFADRRPGDVAVSYADPSLAREKLAWSTSRDLLGMCADHWRWQEQNPLGYNGQS